MRRILLATTTLLLAAPACTFSPGAPPDDLQVDVAMHGQVAKTDAVMADVTITNVSDHDVQMLSWYLPDAQLQEPLFQLMRDGHPVRYIGPMYKRAQPDASDYVTLAPGASLSRSVDLASFYDLTATGNYTVELTLDNAKLNNGTGSVASLPINSRIEGRAAAPTKPPRPTCTPDQLAQISAALPIAGQYASAARDYLVQTTPSGTPRYSLWFGASSWQTGGWTKAQNDYTAIASALATQTINVDCSCKQKNVYAYVTPTNPYNITVCGAFWTAPTSGTDSKAGTFVHEMSHFTTTASTNDWAYGQAACQSLATTDPTKALDNADSHEYFAENNPALQ